MTQLEEDMEKLVDDVVTKKDLKAAFMIMSEVTGAFAFFGVVITALTVWIPGLGIPVGAGVVIKTLQMMAQEYPKLPTEKRRVIAKCAKYLQGMIS